jgi:hypothetical protein
MVALENCQDYRTPPCRNWLADAVCELGGQVAYFSEPDRPESQMGPVTFRILVAVYVADLRPDVANDVVMQSRVCDPPCKEGEICKGGQCRSASEADCDKPAPVKNEPKPDRCTD